MRILIIEDEKQIADPLKKALEKQNFAVDIAENGKQGYELALFEEFDCILLDLNLPEMDGLSIAKKLRENEIFTPILMLTARDMQANKYEGFESGADDYLTKPFDFKELLFRIRALIKRNSEIKHDVLSVHDIELNTKNMKASKNGVEIDLNKKEFGILEYLMRNQGRVVSQEELLEHVWNSDIDMFTQTIRTNIKTLRQKVDKDKSIIQTLKGRGYIIE